MKFFIWQDREGVFYGEEEIFFLERNGLEKHRFRGFKTLEELKKHLVRVFGVKRKDIVFLPQLKDLFIKEESYVVTIDINKDFYLWIEGLNNGCSIYKDFDLNNINSFCIELFNSQGEYLETLDNINLSLTDYVSEIVKRYVEDIYTYRVGWEDLGNEEHIDYWDYKESELELAKAKFDSIELEKEQRKYILHLGKVEILEEDYK